MAIFRVFTGDDNGVVKAVKFLTQEKKNGDVSATVIPLHEKSADGVQRMAVGDGPGGSKVLAISRSSGSTSLHSFQAKVDEILPEQEWQEPRYTPEDTFIGLAVSKSGIYTCTGRGALRLHPFESDGQVVGEVPPSLAQTTRLPMRVKDWQLSPNETHFAYGGDEVELSLWDAERAFSTKSSTSVDASGTNKKRKSRKDKVQLLPGETWRAKNVPHDNLNLRIPVHITAITFLRHGSQDTAQSHNRILTGNLSGAVRLYDVRAQERPVSNWDGVCKNMGVKSIRCGRAEHQVIVTDAQCNIYCLDWRTGRSLYKYSGIKGAVASTTPLPDNHFASVSLDRFIRLHSAPPPPESATQNMSLKGAVLLEEYLKGTPTVVVWDELSSLGKEPEIRQKAMEARQAREEAEQEEIWSRMAVTGAVKSVEVESDNEERLVKRSKAT